MGRILAGCLILFASIVAAPCTWGADGGGETAKSDKAKPAGDTTTTKPADEPKYSLRYRFKAGETLRWQVEHQAQVKTTVSGTTQTAETTTLSVKMWKVSACQPDGSATFVHSVESVDMRQKLTGRQEVRYNSKTDTEPPVGFQDVAKAVGVPLTEITLDPTGKVLKRLDKQQRPPNQSAHITIPLPDEPVPIGYEWSVPYETTVTTKDGGSRTVKLRQQMKLASVSNGVATIEADHQVLSPVNDPAMEAQLVQSETRSKIRFDIKAGRILSQISDGDKNVVGFQGEASSLHYVTRFTEKLMSVSERKLAGPAAPAPASQTTKPQTTTPSSITTTTKPPSQASTSNSAARPRSSAARPGMQPAKPSYRRR